MNEFLELCREVSSKAEYLPLPSERQPHYQRVLDYITVHPEQRVAIAELFCRCVLGMQEPSPASIYLIRFSMRALKWPEVRVAAQKAYDNEVNGMYAGELKSLLAIYE